MINIKLRNLHIFSKFHQIKLKLYNITSTYFIIYLIIFLKIFKTLVYGLSKITSVSTGLESLHI